MIRYETKIFDCDTIFRLSFYTAQHRTIVTQYTLCYKINSAKEKLKLGLDLCLATISPC